MKINYYCWLREICCDGSGLKREFLCCFLIEHTILCNHRIYNKVAVTLLEVSPYPLNFFNLTIPTGGDRNLHGGSAPLATTVASDHSACAVLSEG